MIQMPHPAAAATLPSADHPPVRGPLWAGVLIVVGGLGGFLAWAATAPLSSAAVAHGQITVDSNRKVVQHQHGGIVADLLVGEGDRVTAGRVLLRLDDLEAGAQREMLDSHLVALLAEEARLLASRDGAATLRPPPELDGRLEEAKVAEVIDGQTHIFQRDREVLAGSVDMLQQQIAQYRAQIASYHAQIKSGEDQLRYNEEEVRDVARLVGRGLERKPRLLSLRRGAAALQASQSDLRGKIAATEQAIGETRLRITTLRENHLRDTNKTLRDVQTRRSEVADKLRAATVEHRRRDIVAPQDGVVLNLRYFSSGAVIPPGGAILDIVPDADRKVVDARVHPNDIDVVREGLPAEIILTAYKSRTTPRFRGRVTRVSADAMVQEKTGESYYVARIEIDPEELAAWPEVRLLPGMPAETFIVTGARTALDYITRPIRDSLRLAFREE